MADWALDYVRHVIEKLDTTASDLAAKVGVSSTTLTRPLNQGGGHPYSISRKTLEKIRATTGIPFPADSGLRDAPASPDLMPIETDMIRVPVYDVSASAGHGAALVAMEEQVDEMAFAAKFIRSMTAAPVGHMSIIQVKGDSMEPTMLDGDKVLVDRSHTSLDFDGLYVLRYGQALHVKRVGRHRRRGWVTITSDNDQYREIEAEYSDVDIVGRVLWFGRKV